MPDRPELKDETPPEALNPQFWSARYREGGLGWDLGEASPPYVNLWESGEMKTGAMLIPGCGRGWEAVFFAQRGFEVTAVDFAPEALDEASRLARDAGARIETRRLDFLDPPTELSGRFDVILEQTCFCAIHPTRRPFYVAAAVHCLKPGGEVIGLFYHTGEQGGPPFDTDPEDVRRLFSPFFKIEHFAVTPHSHPRRREREWLGRFRKKTSSSDRA